MLIDRGRITSDASIIFTKIRRKEARNGLFIRVTIGFSGVWERSFDLSETEVKGYRKGVVFV